MNEAVTYFLNEYAEIPNPQYAILLKGPWGCGKSYFIRQWIEQYKTKNKISIKKIKWLPIYVSLYGLTSTQQITESINKEISPWLYSKGVKFAKQTLLTASKVALRCDINISDNSEKEASLICNLDSSFLLKEDDAKIKGNKILIFDDLERCNINFETLFGYINYFVEHCKCKVIIIGDEDKIVLKESEDLKIKYKDFKEKTIGRTFEIIADTDETIGCFIEEIHNNNHNLLKENKELITKIFKASKFNNLRVLRQCLNDYHRIVMSFPEHFHRSKQYAKTVSSLLANFVAVYCEYKSGNTKIKEYVHNQIFGYDHKSEEYKEREKLLSKYHYINIEKGISLLNEFVVEIIVDYIETGYFKGDYIKQIVCTENKSLPSWERLYDYWSMSNEEYEENYNNTVKYYFADKCTDFKELFLIISAFSILHDKGLVAESKERIIQQGKESINRLLNGIDDICVLVENKAKANNFMRYENNSQSDILNILRKYFNETINKKIEECPNEISVTLENLNDQTCGSLFKEIMKPVPGTHYSYIHTPIFLNIDTSKVVFGILRLSNESKNTFYHFLLNRYFKNEYLNEKELTDICRLELPNLRIIYENLNTEIVKKRLIEKYSINKIISLIERIIDDRTNLNNG